MVNGATVATNKCQVCGGQMTYDEYEKRKYCMICGRGKYYGMPVNTAHIYPDMWPFNITDQVRNYRVKHTKVSIETRDRKPASTDTGCQFYPSCLDCPVKICQDPAY